MTYQMKMFSRLIGLLGVLILLGGCFDKASEETSNTSGNSAPKQTEQSSEKDKSTHTSEGEKTDTNESTNTISKEPANSGSEDKSNESNDSNTSDKENKDPLAPYSSEQIEYARVWLQLGANQDIDELNIRHIPVGEPINPNIDNSATYPEGVIQLSGSRLIDGSITYKGNGDGTINVYNAPMRWEAPPPDVDEKTLQEDTEEILNNTKKIYIEPAEGENIIKLINLQRPYRN
ncbi:hypothetical protein [Niallia sp. BSM11]|uniref:hypothetical protein n=1 Tax=Niallia sp. BSM11 TaxID=3391576 RepID=UPI0039853685